MNKHNNSKKQIQVDEIWETPWRIINVTSRQANKKGPFSGTNVKDKRTGETGGYYAGLDLSIQYYKQIK